MKKGSRVVAVGSPQGFLNTVSEGLYSGVYLLDTEYILFTAAISAGSSGGALFNEEGEVVGITAATWDEAQNLNFAVPIENVILLWESYNSDSYSGKQDIPVNEFYQEPVRLSYYSVADVLKNPFSHEGEVCIIYGYLSTITSIDEKHKSFYLVDKQSDILTDPLDEFPFGGVKYVSAVLQNSDYYKDNGLVIVDVTKLLKDYNSGDSVALTGTCHLQYDVSGNYVWTEIKIDKVDSFYRG